MQVETMKRILARASAVVACTLSICTAGQAAENIAAIADLLAMPEHLVKLHGRSCAALSVSGVG